MDEILRWVTPSLILLLGWFIRGLVSDLKEAVRALAIELKAAMQEVSALRTQHAVTESRLNRLESDVGGLHGRVSRLITDRILKEADSA